MWFFFSTESRDIKLDRNRLEVEDDSQGRHRRSSARTDVRRFNDVATLCSHTKRCLRQRPVVPNAIQSNFCPRCDAMWFFFSTESRDIKLDRNRLEVEDDSQGRHRRSSARTDVRRFNDVATLCSNIRRCIHQRPVAPNALQPNVCLICEATRHFFSTESCDVKLDRNRLEVEDDPQGRHRRSSARTDVRRFEDVATLCSHTKRCLRQRPVVPKALQPNVCPKCEAIRYFFSTKNCDVKLDRNRLEVENRTTETHVRSPNIMRLVSIYHLGTCVSLITPRCWLFAVRVEHELH